jgi:hypothetical protein
VRASCSQNDDSCSAVVMLACDAVGVDREVKVVELARRLVCRQSSIDR